mmetsp:Transcript_146782/g.259400  ORF Transcript_146782/g.259400 Transcript_146782/m.259400 type:complete len:517 (-) Transcript_146782:73-1623(-)
MTILFYSMLNCFLLLASAMNWTRVPEEAWISDHISLLQVSAWSQSASLSHEDEGNVSKIVEADKLGQNEDSDVLMLLTADSELPANPRPEISRLPGSWILVLMALLMLQMSQRAPIKGEPLATESWTGVRALVALQVWTGHLVLHRLTGSGAFLLLSGAMLTIGKTVTIGQPKDYVRYVSMRLFRIIPAALVAQAYRHSNLASHETDDWSKSPLSVLFAFPFTHPAYFFQYQSLIGERHDSFWFISCVIFLYLLCPFFDMFFAWCGTRKSISRCAWFAIVCYIMQLGVAAFALLTPPNPDLDGQSMKNFRRTLFGVYDVRLYCHPVARLPQFLLGVLVAHALTAMKSKSTEDNASGTVAAKTSGTVEVEKTYFRVLGVLTDAAVLSIPGLAWLTNHVPMGPILTSHGPVQPSNMRLFTTFNLWSPIFALLLLGLGHPKVKSISKLFFTQPLILELGKISYGVYLYGFLIAHLDGSTRENRDWWYYLVSYGATLLAAYLSFHIVEEPSQRFIRWLWS